MTAQFLLFAVWANNHGGDAGDSVAAVRAERRADTERIEAKWDRLVALDAADSRTERVLAVDSSIVVNLVLQAKGWQVRDSGSVSSAPDTRQLLDDVEHPRDV